MKWSVISVSSLYGYIYIFLCSELSLDQWYQSSLLFYFLWMSPMRSRYKDLGLNLVEPLQDQPHKPQRPIMVKETKDKGEGYPMKILLKEALEE